MLKLYTAVVVVINMTAVGSLTMQSTTGNKWHKVHTGRSHQMHFLPVII